MEKNRRILSQNIAYLNLKKSNLKGVIVAFVFDIVDPEKIAAGLGEEALDVELHLSAVRVHHPRYVQVLVIV